MNVNQILNSSHLQKSKIQQKSKQQQIIKTQKLDHNLLQKQCIKRKKQNYNKLKIWDEQRAYILSIHRKTLDAVRSSIESKINDSINYSNLIIQFFSKQVLQYKQYSQEKFQNPIQKIMENYIGRNICMSQTESIDKIYLINKKHQSNFKQVAEQIDQKLIKVIQYNLHTSQNQIMQHRQIIDSLLLQLQQINTQTSQVCCSLAAQFHKQKNITFKSQDDLYSKQQQFMNYANQQTSVQQKLAEQILNFLEKVQRIEVKRGKLIRNIIIEYTKILQKIKYKQIPEILFQQLKKDQESILIYEYFSCQQMLQNQNLSQIKSIIRKDQSEYLSFQQFKQYMFSLQFNYFKGQDLLLKQFQVSYRIDQQRSAQTIILITVDAFIFLYKAFQKKQNLPNKPDFQFKLDNSIKIIDQNDISLTISCRPRIGTYFMNYLLKKKGFNQQGFQFNVCFANTSQKLQFCTIVQTILLS